MSSMGGAWPDDGMDGDWSFQGADSGPSQPLTGIIPTPPNTYQPAGIISTSPQDQSAVFVPRSAYGSPPVLQDPGPSNWPAPTLDQVATGQFFRMTDQQLAATRSGAENQARAQQAARELLAPAVEGAVTVLDPATAEKTVPDLAKDGFDAASRLLDVYNGLGGLFDEHQVQNASDQAVLKALSDALNQQVESQAAQRGHGLYLP